MLLDSSFINLYLQNLGTTIDSLISLTNTVLFHTGNINFEAITRYLTLINVLPTDSQWEDTINSVYFTVYMNPNYLDAVRELYNTLPYAYSLDYLHFYYAEQLFYNLVVSSFTETTTALTHSLTINLHFDIFISFFTNKWGYALTAFTITYYFSNLMKFRYQYGFNFFFVYFKTLSDLGEQEYGSYDDYQFFVFFLCQMFLWYCWVFFIGYTFFLQSESKLVLLTVSVMLTILTIPVRLLWDFGLAFGMYVRGAASSSNLVVEAFFDIIGVIIIFTRFVVQNIRFLLVFVAFFELFEWTTSSSEMSAMLRSNISYLENTDIFTAAESGALAFYVLTFIKTSFFYLYHLLHLIIVSFMQIGVYLMVSFWLFFFLYTSFLRITLDTYFWDKRN